MRSVAPELLVTAKTQRWTPEELLRALVETEINARDASNTRLRGKQACFPMLKTIAEFEAAQGVLEAHAAPPAAPALEGRARALGLALEAAHDLVPGEDVTD